MGKPSGYDIDVILVKSIYLSMSKAKTSNSTQLISSSLLKIDCSIWRSQGSNLKEATYQWHAMASTSTKLITMAKWQQRMALSSKKTKLVEVSISAHWYSQIKSKPSFMLTSLKNTYNTSPPHIHKRVERRLILTQSQETKEVSPWYIRRKYGVNEKDKDNNTINWYKIYSLTK